MNVTCNVNGNEHSFECEPRELLADVLRDRLGLTGTHLACEQGACGACTVHLDGMAVLSCLIFAVQTNGRDVRTIEGVGAPDQLHPLQEQFARHHGLQCGFCTPGMVLAALDLLDREAEPTRTDIEEALSGNLCRCTGYAGIVDAVHAASGSVQEVGA